MRKFLDKYDAMIKELVDLEFPEWRKKLTELEIRQIVPEDILKMKITAPTQSALRTYFIEHILSTRFKREDIS